VRAFNRARQNPVRLVALAALAAPVSLAFGALAPGAARAEGSVGVLVLREHGVGSAAQAQPYVDKFVALAARQNGWTDAKGQYQTSRGQAEPWIEAQKPHYGILTLPAFLGLKDKHALDVIGQVAVARAGGQQYSIVGKVDGDIGACKGKRLATDHGDDPTFIDRVVFAGKVKLADFTLVATTRPLQTLKKVVTGEADCALIDDAQLEEMGRSDETKVLKSVWKSDKLPPMVVVAFPAAPAAERKAFQSGLAKLCEGDGKATCGEVGILALKSASAADYSAAVTAYGK
jgi:ABC-type amino acid transport substrate-binding protein